MGTNDQDNDSPPPGEQPRDVELTNDAMLSGENGDQQPQRSGQNRGDGQAFRGKRRIARRKIRVADQGTDGPARRNGATSRPRKPRWRAAARRSRRCPRGACR